MNSGVTMFGGFGLGGVVDLRRSSRRAPAARRPPPGTARRVGDHADPLALQRGRGEAREVVRRRSGASRSPDPPGPCRRSRRARPRRRRPCGSIGPGVSCVAATGRMPVAADQADRRLEADDALRAPAGDELSGVGRGLQSRPSSPRGRTRRGRAGAADEPPGVLSVSVGISTWPPSERVALGHVRVEEVGELGDVRLAEHDRAGRLQLGHERRVACRASSSAARSSRRWSACRATSMLSSTITGMPCSGPRDVAGGALGVERRRLLERLRVERADRLDRRALGVGAARSAPGRPWSASPRSACRRSSAPAGLDRSPSRARTARLGAGAERASCSSQSGSHERGPNARRVCSARHARVDCS